MYFCICNDTGKNIFGQIQSGNEKELTAQAILNQHCSGSNTLWLKTERYAYALQPDDHPFVDQPNLILSEKPEKTPATAFYLFPNYDSSSKVLYFLPKHDTNQKIPRLTIVIPQSDLGSDLNRLSTIIEQSFITPANVKEILVNDEPLNGNVTINDVFENAKNGKEIAVSLSFDEACIQKIRLRENLCNEIVYSENNFVNDLTVINTDWKQMFEEENFLAATDFKALFNDIPMILAVHTKFGQMLKQSLDGYGSQFSECFIQYHPFFKSSMNYITNYPGINEILTLKNDQPEFNQKCKEMASSHKGRDFASYLITPVQRIPRYLLFLRELSKLTPPNHPDYLYLNQAVQVMTNLAQEIDKKTEIAEKQNVLYNIQLRNYTDFVYCKPARKVIKIYDTIIKNRNLEGNLVVCDDYVFLIDKPDMFCRFRAPIDAFPADFLKDGQSFKVLNTDEPDNLIETTVQMLSKEDLEEFQKTVLEASINDFNSTTGNDQSILWEVSPLTERAPRLCKHSGVYVKNKGEEYYLFYGGYTIKSDESVDANVETRTITYQRNNIIYCFTPPDQYKEINSGIPGRYNHRLAYANNKFFIIGGLPSSQTFYVYDNNLEGEQVGWRKINAPDLDLTGHTVVQHQNHLYIYGGTPFKDDVYELNTDNYSVKAYNDFPEGQKPEQRTNHSSIIYKNKIYVYGGADNIGRPLSDLWCFDLESKKWEMKGEFNSPRAGHQGLLLGNEYVIIGGRPQGDSFSINLETLEKKVVKDFGNFPSCLNGFGVAAGDNNTAIIYGGLESSSKTPKNTVYTLKLSNDWNQKVTDEESKNPEITAEKAQQNEREPIITSFRAVNLDADDLPEAENNEVINDSDQNSSLLSEPFLFGPGNGDLEPWTLTPEEAEELAKKSQEEKDNGSDSTQQPATVTPKDTTRLDNIESIEPEPTPTQDEASPDEDEITNGDEMPWTLTPEQAEELVNKLEKEKTQEEEQPPQAEDATNEEKPTDTPEQNANEDWIVDPDAQKENNEAIDDDLINDGNQFEANQSKELNGNANGEEENNFEPDDLIDDDLLNENEEEEKTGGNKFEPGNEQEEETAGNRFEPDNENKDLREEEEEITGNQFEVDEDHLLNEFEEEEEISGNKYEQGNENMNSNEEEEEMATPGNQFEPDNENNNFNEEEEMATPGNQFEPDNDKNIGNNEEEEQYGGSQFEPSQNNEEEQGNQPIIEEEEEENENRNEEEQENQSKQESQDQENQENQDQENQENQENPKQDNQENGQHPSKKYQFQFEYKPSEEEEEENEEFVRPPKKKPEWSFEMPEDPPRKFDPIFYPESPGSRKRKKTQPKKKNNSQMSPTGGASGKPPIFNVSNNYDYYYNYNNNSPNNNNSSLNYSLNNSGFGGYSPFSPKRPVQQSPKTSLYPNVLDDITPKKKLEQQIRQRQQQQQSQRHQDSQNSSQYTSSISSSAVSPQKRVQSHHLQDRERNKQGMVPPSSNIRNEKVSPKRQKVTPSRNQNEPKLEQEYIPPSHQKSRQQKQKPQPEEPSTESIQSSSLLNSSSEKIENTSSSRRQQQHKPKLELSPVSAKECESPTDSSQQIKSNPEHDSQTSPSRARKQSSATSKSANKEEEEKQPILSASISIKTETESSIELDQSTASSSKPQKQQKSDKSENKEAKLSDQSNDEEKKSKKDKDKKKNKDKKKDNDKEKEKDKKDKDKEKEKDKKDKDKKKDKKKERDSKKKDDDEKEKDKRKDKERDDKRKSRKRDDEEKKHHCHHTHRSDHSQPQKRSRYENQEDEKINDNSHQQQNRSDNNNMTRTNDTMPLIFDTSPIKKPTPGSSKNMNNFNNVNNFNNDNDNEYKRPKVNKKSKFDKINPYYYNNDIEEEKVIRRRKRDDDDESSDILSFKRNPNFKRAAQNQLKFDDDFDIDSSDFGANDFGKPYDNNVNDTKGNSNRYFNFKLRGSNPPSNININNAPNTKSQYNPKHRPKQTFMTTYNLQGEINCSYLPKFNIYGVNNFPNNAANPNPYAGGGVGIGYKPTNYRKDHARGNRNNRYNVIDDSDSFNPFSNSF